MTDDTGYREAPVHYAGNGGPETIDIIRERLGDRLFAGYCLGNALKYRLRSGKKAGTDDEAKARWYDAMAAHVLEPAFNPDPRIYRERK